jgi:four helix bundle protein
VGTAVGRTTTRQDEKEKAVSEANVSESKFAEERFHAKRVTLELIESLAPLHPLIRRQDRDLADQLQRAASSVYLNLSEGERSEKGNRHKHFGLAHGSANEVKAALQVALAWGWLGAAERPFALLDRLLAMMWKLTRG